MIHRVCYCGKEFDVWPYATRNGHGQYCSRTCANSKLGSKLTSYSLSTREAPKYKKDHALLQVGKRNFMKVSLEDVDAVSSIAWSIVTSGYAVTSPLSGVIHAHRLIFGRKLGRKLTSKEVADHINHDKLDNRRENLRVATASQNNINRTRNKGYRGVYCVPSTGNWRAYVGGKVSTGKQLKLGTYPTSEEAAWMYDQWASQLYGEFAVLNFEYV